MWVCSQDAQYDYMGPPEGISSWLIASRMPFAPLLQAYALYCHVWHVMQIDVDQVLHLMHAAGKILQAARDAGGRAVTAVCPGLALRPVQA